MTSLQVKNTTSASSILISVLQIDFVFISLGHFPITDSRFVSGNCVVRRDGPIRPIAHDYNSIGNDNKTPTGVQVVCEGGRVSPAPPVLFVHRVNKNHNIGNNNNNITSEHSNIYYYYVALRQYIFYCRTWPRWGRVALWFPLITRRDCRTVWPPLLLLQSLRW